MGALTTPSPYLRDGLLTVVADLRGRAKEAAERHAAADAEVERLCAELAAAEQHAATVAAEHASIVDSLDWANDQAAQLTKLIDAAPAERLAETGLMVEPPGVVERPAMVGSFVDSAGQLHEGPSPCAKQAHGVCNGCDQCPEGCHELDSPNELVTDSRAEIARVTGGIPVVPPPVPASPGVTMPDTGLAPAPLPPAPETDGPRHEKAKGGRVTGAFRKVGLIHRDPDEQDGDDRG